MCNIVTFRCIGSCHACSAITLQHLSARFLARLHWVLQGRSEVVAQDELLLHIPCAMPH